MTACHGAARQHHGHDVWLTLYQWHAEGARWFHTWSEKNTDALTKHLWVLQHTYSKIALNPEIEGYELCAPLQQFGLLRRDPSPS